MNGFVGNDVVTPIQLVTALKHYGGLPNCITELVKLERETVAKVVIACATVETKLKKAMKRKNDVFFTQIDWSHRNEMPTSSNNEESYQNMPCFSLQGFEYSGSMLIS